jgi:two-component system cell cycle sensor histidine kinase/response regulator CckA
MTPDSPAATETILLVDDEPAIRQLIQRALTSKGYTVLVAENGNDALEVADRHKAPIHLVVSDVAMPDMDGRQLFHHLRTWYPKLRFLFISGQMEGAGADVSMDGRTAFLPKPFSMELLLKFVRYVIDGDLQSAP